MEINLKSFKEASVKEETDDDLVRQLALEDLVKQLESEQASINDLVYKIKNHVAYGSGDLSDDTDKLMKVCHNIQILATKLHDNL